MILSDTDIKERIKHPKTSSVGLVIKPFHKKQIREGKISYGLSSYGYDIRVAKEFKIFSPLPIDKALFLKVDPKEFDSNTFHEFRGVKCTIPANSFALARSVEYVKIPRDVIAICVGKSTYARCGIIINVTPLEPEWEGYITLEISNTTPLPAIIYGGEGIAQLLFLQGYGCEVSYSDKKGKYQNQKGVTLPKI